MQAQLFARKCSVAHIGMRLAILLLLLFSDQVCGQEIVLPASPLQQVPPHCEVQRQVYTPLNAVEWQLRLNAPDGDQQPLFENVRSADFEIDVPGELVTLHWNKGSHAQPSDFQPLTGQLVEGQGIKLESFGGRSSDGTLPYFNLAGENCGLILAIGWSGDWQATFQRLSNGKVHIEAGLKQSRFKLRPGESVRLPSILAITYQADWLEGQNKFRRLMLEHFTPTSHEPMKLMPVAASVHGMLGFNDTTEQNLTTLASDVAALKLPIDTFWLDAGWNVGGFPAGQGNAQPDPQRFPRGLAPVGQAVNKQSWRFLVWFEPERAMRGTQLLREHPEWLLKPTDTPAELRYMENDGFHLLDLGNSQARAWAVETVTQQLREAQVTIYRHDFNEYPAYFWHTDAGADEVGLREVRYITGLYDYLDQLAQQQPNLILDHCASGGRRLDFEIMRRCVSLWRSDSCWDDASYPRNVQCMTHGLSLWLPLHGLGSVATNPIALRSGMGACASFPINYRDAKSVKELRTHLDRYLPIRELFAADFYPLTAWSDKPDQWLAYQFYDSAKKEGLVQAFWGAGGGSKATSLKLCGVESDVEYVISEWDHPDNVTIQRGSELMSGGLDIPVSPGPQAIVWHIKAR